VAVVKAATIVEQEELDDFEDDKEQEPVKQVLSTEAGLDVIREGEERDADVGHECKGDGRVAISNWGTPQAYLTAFNCVSHLERFHGGRERAT
jgi:hypothetical protein